MTDDSGLIGLRTKEIQLRLLDRARIRSEKLYWQMINNVIPLAFVLIFAIFNIIFAGESMLIKIYTFG